jgi:hypothetical protein
MAVSGRTPGSGTVTAQMITLVGAETGATAT